MKNYKKNLLVILLIFLATLGFSQNIRIATIAPENSPWGEGLKRLGAEWARITNNRVRVSFFFNGIAGGEEDSIRKMRIGQLQGLALTSSGINLLSDAVLTLSAPMLIRTDNELDYVLDQMSGVFDTYLEEQEVIVAGWSQGGWIRLFSKNEIRTPTHLRSSRLALSPTEPDLNRALTTMGFRGVGVNTNEVLSGLNSGLIDSFLYSPIGAAGFQWFAVAPFMLELEISPFLGAIVISSRIWRQVPDQFKEEMIAAAQRVSADIGSEIRQLENEAIRTMTQFGLKTVRVNDQERQQWFEFFEQSVELTLGNIFNREVYRQVQTMVQSQR